MPLRRRGICIDVLASAATGGEATGCRRPSAAAVQQGEVPEHPRARGGGDRDRPAAVMVLNRNGADRRRDRMLDPVTLADVEHVKRSEHRSHGAAIGAKPRRFCDGTRFRYVFT